MSFPQPAPAAWHSPTCKRLLSIGLSVPLAVAGSLATAAPGNLPPPSSPELARVTPAHPVGWRGDGSGHFPAATPPLTWGLKNGVGSNIAWQVELPGESPSSVIVVGQRLFTTVNDYGLVCLDKRTGKILWMQPVSPYDAVTKEERDAHPEAFAQLTQLAQQRDALIAGIPAAAPGEVAALGGKIGATEKEMEKVLCASDKEKYKSTGMTWSDGGFMSSTPTSDGSCVYAWNAWGVTACFDLDGRRKWIRFDALRPQEHGQYSSPLLAGNLLITCIGKQFLAIDKQTGREAWKSECHTPAGDWSGYWYGSHIATVINGEDVLVAGDGSLIRSRDGYRFAKGSCQQAAAAPVVGGGFVFWLEGPLSTPLHYYQLPATAGTNAVPVIKGRGLTLEGSGYLQSSPLFHDGLLYLLGTNPYLYVYDVAAEKLLYRQKLDFGETPKRSDRPYGCGIAASPALAGGRIFITGNFGTTLIIEPGREYKQIASNTIDQRFTHNYQTNMLEGTVSCPFFDGPRIYYRAQRHLYCIEKKESHEPR